MVGLLLVLVVLVSVSSCSRSGGRKAPVLSERQKAINFLSEVRNASNDLTKEGSEIAGKVFGLMRGVRIASMRMRRC